MHIIPPDEMGVNGACYDIKKYLSLRPKNAKENFFLHVNKDSKGIYSFSNFTNNAFNKIDYWLNIILLFRY